MKHTYKIKYDLKNEIGSFKKEEVEETGEGLTDALLVFSLLFPEDGSYTQCHFSIDGRTGEPLTDKDLFKIWIMLASQLGESTELSPFKRDLPKTAFEIFRNTNNF